MPTPTHTQLRESVSRLADVELDQWTADETAYALEAFSPARLGAWTLWLLTPARTSRPVGVVVARHDDTGELLVTSGNAEAVATVLAGVDAADDHSLATLVHNLYRALGRDQNVVAESAHAHREAGGWTVSFDVNDAWNGTENWMAHLHPGKARVHTLGVA